jgi:hypothetical protein
MPGLEAIRSLAQQFYRSPAHVRWLDIVNDAGLTAAAREERAAPLKKTLEADFDRRLLDSRKRVADSQITWQEHTPRALQLAAYLADPVRARGVRDDALRDAPGALRQTVRRLVKRNDAAAAHAVRAALGERTDVSEEMRTDILRELSEVGTQGYRETLGDLLAAKKALWELETAGLRGDPSAALLDEAARKRMMTGDAEWRTVVDDPDDLGPDDKPRAREIPEAEARQLLAEAGYPAGLLLAGVLPTAPDDLTRFLAGAVGVGGR